MRHIKVIQFLFFFVLCFFLAGIIYKNKKDINELNKKTEQNKFIQEKLNDYEQEKEILDFIDTLIPTKITGSDRLIISYGIRNAIYKHSIYNDYKKDAILLSTISDIESDFNCYAVSSTGAKGICQILPSTEKYLLSLLKNENIDIRIPQDGLYNSYYNYELSMYYLKRIRSNLPKSLTDFEKDVRMVLKYADGPNAKSIKTANLIELLDHPYYLAFEKSTKQK